MSSPPPHTPSPPARQPGEPGVDGLSESERPGKRRCSVTPAPYVKEPDIVKATQVNGYIGRFECFKKILLTLGKESLPNGVARMHDFIDGEWLKILHVLPDRRQIKKFQPLFDTVNVILMLQCFHIIEKRAKEMGVEV